MYRRLQGILVAGVLVTVSACGAPVSTSKNTIASAPTTTSAPIATSMPSPTAAASSPPAPTSTPRADQQADGITLLGALQLETTFTEAYGDIATYKNLALIGMSRFACGQGIPIIDISNPTTPSLLAHTPSLNNVAMEDLEAIRIGDRDVLAVGLQQCQSAGPEAPRGLDLFDITDPRQPRRLSTFALPPTNGVYGVHEFDLITTPDGRSLALLAVPDFEARTAQDEGQDGIGDLLIVDISDPAQPKQIAEWGLMGDATLGPRVMHEAPQGNEPGVYLHSVRANADGTRAFLSYWDAGVVILDINEPSAPAYIGRTTFAGDEEGNAHSVAISDDARVLIEASEDFSPKHPAITSTAFTGRRAVLAQIPTGKAPTGEVVHAGRGCPADTVPEQAAADVYTQEISGTIALLDPGGCRPEQKAIQAQLAGATGVILYGGETFNEMHEIMKQSVVVQLPTGKYMALAIPVLLASDTTAKELIAAGAGTQIEFTYDTNGWGGLRIFDINDPERPVQLSAFARVNTDHDGVALGSTGFANLWSVHNPELRDNVLFASWYRDGVRMIDIRDPQAPREVGFWTGKGAPSNAPPVDIWGIALHDDLILASDRNFGVYILKAEP